MDAKAKARTSPTAKKDLAIKESILGVLNAKDKTGKGSIPISEFENVIDAFGVSWDSPAVQNVLNHCKVEKNERMNFSSLKEELKLEKERLHAKPSGRYTRAPLTAPAVPQASGILKEKREALKEKQRRAVQVQTDQIHTIYNMLSRHDIDKSTAINLLSQYQIYPTKELVKIASEMEVNDVPFGEFSRALTASEPYSRTSEILASETSTVFAGGSRRTPVDRFGADEAVPGRRLFEIPKSQHFAPPDEPVQMGSFKPGRKLLDQARGKSTCMGALFNETGESWLGQPQEIDWSSDPAGRRHLIVDDEIGVDYARAQLNHGNCVTWQCDITELEERNAALEKPEGRKVRLLTMKSMTLINNCVISNYDFGSRPMFCVEQIDDQQLVCNYFSDVISWGNFREEGKIGAASWLLFSPSFPLLFCDQCIAYWFIFITIKSCLVQSHLTLFIFILFVSLLMLEQGALKTRHDKSSQ